MMNLAKYIDHTLLKPEATQSAIEALCQEAKTHDFMSVCVNPTWVPLAAKALERTDVKVCTVIGFPLGANVPEVKAFEAAKAVEDGAQEVDMVINIGALKSENWDLVELDIQAVVAAVPDDVIVKVIIETCLLTKEEIAQVSLICKKVGADFVKTSTGFSTGGATVEDVAWIRETVGPEMDIKASGGVSNRQDAIKMIEAGATRLGASKGIQIVSE